MNAKALGIGLIGTSGVAVGGYYGINALNDKEAKIEQKSSIKSLLENKKYVPITKERKRIQTILSNYQKSITNATLKLGNFEGKEKEGKSASDILLEECESIFQKTEVNDEINKATRWCVEPETIESLAKKFNFVALNATDGTNDAEWGNKVEEYNRTESDIKPKIAGLEIKFSSPDTKVQKIKELKTECEKLSKKGNHEDEFEKGLEAFELWCANKQ